MAANMRMKKAIFKYNAKVIIDVISSKSFNDSKLYILIQDALYLVDTIPEKSFIFVPRPCIWVAHNLAKRALISVSSVGASDVFLD